ncbi:MAG: DUF1931 domain-containing protein [Candidatus Aenigmarchaeota archaeon]|nr:DUF1931 domain-containing protein [Candidatus Aenigmarchaeota archaeon]
MGLVVASAAKEVIKKEDMNCGGDFVEALDKVIDGKIKKACGRAKANGRKTVRGDDL